eukprot:1532019-Rhodomonas_salina.6
MQPMCIGMGEFTKWPPPIMWRGGVKQGCIGEAYVWKTCILGVKRLSSERRKSCRVYWNVDASKDRRRAGELISWKKVHNDGNYVQRERVGSSEIGRAGGPGWGYVEWRRPRRDTYRVQKKKSNKDSLEARDW